MSAERHGYGFSTETKDKIYEAQNGRCNLCDIEDSRNNRLECHHKVKIEWARQNLEPLPEVKQKIKSPENGEYLCPRCHKKEHEEETDEKYKLLAIYLIGNNWFLPEEKKAEIIEPIMKPKKKKHKHRR
ncbi:MAG: HNH endonuclease [Candidatus Shapirobacteria bacterium]|nr:HNH endonuclease [Candidatus Shapirobacteria bacterium]